MVAKKGLGEEEEEAGDPRADEEQPEPEGPPVRGAKGTPTLSARYRHRHDRRLVCLQVDLHVSSVLLRLPVHTQ